MRESTRKEFEAARFEVDPELVSAVSQIQVLSTVPLAWVECVVQAAKISARKKYIMMLLRL